MNLLLDTHVLIWAIMDTSKLSPTARFHLVESENKVYVSAVSLWEIAIKHALGKLDLKGVAPADLVTYATDEVGFNLLDLNSRLVAEYGHVPALHPDPFDRMLIHQAVSGGFSLVSADRKFKEYKSYGLKLVW